METTALFKGQPLDVYVLRPREADRLLQAQPD